ncbi:hypothetical protein RN01_01870 [Cupriavidus sp. SHE]|uniref:DUF1254 domain-containing protein n=1 Tax=Cupriavidus metallidurans TaxID=119219 RepID=A0A2L0X324_9BURK|nr:MULTISPECIES: DUF1254 domain-containing protein [Cupriavidus]AVA34504.1 DUF1254 domain-containing protein [Cupriavidus metallidurans]KWR86358.1 hypothetical protein RN01_01870 [Cupriavidus sp. SHE]QBP12444.1 DUF1254 domain-containing protein [Cupriavidus metallidurans]
MNSSIRRLAGAVALAVFLSACSSTSERSATDSAVEQPPSDQAMKTLSAEVFTYAYPLVLMDVTREVATAKVPVNTFGHKRAFPDAAFTDVVSPNADTLYSSAWLDLSKEPMVLSVPDTSGRYYLMPMLDAWTNVFASPGKRTTGTKRGVFAIVGPNWQGQLPKGVKEIRSPTDMAWLIGRIQTNGKQDYANVHRLQDQFRLVPLSAWRKGSRTAVQPVPRAAMIDTETPPAEQVAAMDAQAFFTRLAALLPANPPAADDAAMVEKMQRMGIKVGQPFKTTVLEPSTARAVQEGASAALTMIKANGRKSAAGNMGWRVQRDIGVYGTDYGRRAVVAMFGLGANLPEDAIYPTARADAMGRPFDGGSRYVLHFDKSQLPPVKAFWSLTMYNEKQAFVSNSMQRYAIGSRDRLRYNRDGSLDIYIQYERPDERKVSNWLPAPPDAFNLMLRAYWPDQVVLDGKWMPPAVQRVN